jgi:hypothetical protein
VVASLTGSPIVSASAEVTTAASVSAATASEAVASTVGVTEAALSKSPQRGSGSKAGRSRPSHKTPADKRSQTVPSTPNITTFFDKKRHEKRKGLASSPDQQDLNGQGKVHKSDRGVS